MRKKMIGLIVLTYFGLPLTFCQTVIGSAGGILESDVGTSLSWTVGEVNISTLSSDNFILTNGFHQAYFNFSKISEENKVNVVLYPNPATNKIFLNLNPEKHPFVTLIDALGKIYINTEFESLLDIGQLESGIYYLKISAPYNVTLKFEKL